MNRENVLRWIERGLLTVGVVLGAWCAAVLVEARFHQAMPVAAPLKVTQTAVPVLPGDRGSSAPHPAAPSAPAVGSVIAKLDAPSVQMTTTVLEGSDEATLSRGAGHIEDTPFPGQPGNIGIAGHRDTVFRPLRHIKVGDPLHITTADRTYRYRISKTLIVGPDDVYVLDPTDRSTVTLVTCYPFDFIGHAPKRFIVQAELTDPIDTEPQRR
jgi:sortase A